MASKKIDAVAIPDDLATIISARTGLTPKDDAIMRTLPVPYLERSVGEALNFLLESPQSKRTESALLKSIKQEMSGEVYIVAINGQNALLTDNVSKYVTMAKHTLPDGSVKTYRSLEFEISKDEGGGYYAGE